MESSVRNQQLVAEAMNGKQGCRQYEVAAMGLKLTATLLRKNKDYGSSAFESPILAPDTPAETAIRVRLSDKLARLKNLLRSGEEAAVVTESTADTALDAAGYLLLWLIAQENDQEDKRKAEEG